YEFPSAQHWTAPDVLAPPARCPLYPQKRTSGLTRGMSALCQKRTLADYPITSSGECEQGRRHINAKRFCGFEIDCHLKFGRKLHRKVAGRSALQYAIDVGGCATMQVRQVYAVRYQTSVADPESKRIHGRHAIAIGKRNDDLAF